jgi:hypothetical protein
VYVAGRVLVQLDYVSKLRRFFGPTFDGLKPFHKQGAVSAKAASYAMWYEAGEPGGVEQFDAHYRRVRTAFNRLLELGYLRKNSGGDKGYLVNELYASQPPQSSP